MKDDLSLNKYLPYIADKLWTIFTLLFCAHKNHIKEWEALIFFRYRLMTISLIETPRVWARTGISMFSWRFRQGPSSWARTLWIRSWLCSWTGPSSVRTRWWFFCIFWASLGWLWPWPPSRARISLGSDWSSWWAGMPWKRFWVRLRLVVRMLSMSWPENHPNY